MIIVDTFMSIVTLFDNNKDDYMVFELGECMLCRISHALQPNLSGY